jgi:alcohol dehydrogenase class IV
MNPFEYNANPGRVVFGTGSIKRLPDEIRRLKLSSPLLLSGPRQANLITQLQEILHSSSPSIKPAGTFSKATMHTPFHVTEEALTYVQAISPDCIVSIGGGSTVGLGKAISFSTGLPHICIPTTYSGSEMTPSVGETKDGRKTTKRDPKILPGTVIYDVDLTISLPASMSATSGVNAIAHAAEALYAHNGNPIINLLALEGIKALAESLPQIVSDPRSQSAREKAQYGAWLCGACLGTVSMSLHHKLCHALGGSFNLPHSETHTIVLPHALSYNATAIPETMEKLASVLPGSGGDAIKGLNVLLEKLKVKRALKDLRMKEEDVGKAAEIVVGNTYSNPRRVEIGPVKEVIRRCWAGEDARADF